VTVARFSGPRPVLLIGRVLEIALWAFVAIAVVILVFGLLSCLAGGSGLFGFRHPLG
jgi:hypothetical protein